MRLGFQSDAVSPAQHDMFAGNFPGAAAATRGWNDFRVNGPRKVAQYLALVHMSLDCSHASLRPICCGNES